MLCRLDRPISLAVAVMVAASSGCSSDGQVKLVNNTGTQLSGSLNDRGFSLSGFESITLTVKIGTRVLFFGADNKSVDLDAESCTLFPLRTGVEVESGKEKLFSIQPDAVCIRVENQGEFEVVQVLRRNTTTNPDAEWVEIPLDGPLNPSGVFSWRLEPGQYGVRMIDECDEMTELVIDALNPGDVRYARHVGLEFCR